MAVVDLPASPGPVDVDFIPISFDDVLTPPEGAAEQQINRLGDRWAVMVQLPPLTLEQAREWSARLVLGGKRGARWQLRQLGLRIGAPGTPRIAGADQSGYSLTVDGMTPFAGWSIGQFVSIVTDGVGYLYHFAEAGNADADGDATFVFDTPLRFPHEDNDVIDFMPRIEGRLVGDARSWKVNAMRLGECAFGIQETE
jgi:hypothetical protein